MGTASPQNIASPISPMGTHPPTRDHEKWDGELFVYTPRRPSRKKQNPERPRRTPCTAAPYIKEAGRGGALCTAAPYIVANPRCTAAPYISRLPFPAAAKAQDQGSSTVRAPATAGGAGSSPAPDANPALAEWHGVGSLRYRLSDDPRAMQVYSNGKGEQ
jgi:hypothetical protein